MTDPTSTVTAGSVIVAALARDVEGLLSAEPAVRSDAPDSVHQMRVATRRLRSVLRTYRPLLEPASIERLRDELQWLGGVLGLARDPEVRAERMERGLAALPKKQVRGPVADRLVGTQRAGYADAHTLAVRALDGARYADLRSRLSALPTDPPLRNRAGKPADRIIADLIDKDYRRLNRLIDAAAESVPGERIAALHDVRKAAKRLRYAAEAAVPALGAEATRITAHAKNLQTVLGDHRDAVESQQLVDATAAMAREAGEDEHTYRLLSASETAAAGKALERYPPAVDTLRG